MGFLQNVGTSFRLTFASLKLVFQYPVVLLLPLLMVVWVGLLIVAPVNFLIWLFNNHPSAFEGLFSVLYFVTYNAIQTGNWEVIIPSFIIHTYILWCIWLTIALTGIYYVSTVGMHVATTQIRHGRPSLGEGFRVATRNFGRIFLLAFFMATVYVWINYFLRFTIGLIPIVGRWIMRGVKLVLTAVSYLMLPIIVYERAGVMNAFKSAWNNVKHNWAGIIVGTGFVYFALWIMFNVITTALLEGLFRETPWLAVGIAVTWGAIVFSIAMSTSAAMRAVFYWYATTGEVPAGFNQSDLPTVNAPGTITGAPLPAGAPGAGTGAAPAPQPLQAHSTAPPVGGPAGAGAPPATGGGGGAGQSPGSGAAARPAQPAGGGGGGGQRLACPRCHTVIATKFGEKPVCPTCGFGS